MILRSNYLNFVKPKRQKVIYTYKVKIQENKNIYTNVCNCFVLKNYIKILTYFMLYNKNYYIKIKYYNLKHNINFHLNLIIKFHFLLKYVSM